MREIKFMAWNPILKTMRGPFFIKDMNIALVSNLEMVWLQFTGLRDKNSKEIYEGGILKTDCNGYGLPGTEVVEWHDTAALFMPFGGGDLGWDMKYTEVIGNIYENPELLKK